MITCTLSWSKELRIRIFCNAVAYAGLKYKWKSNLTYWKLAKSKIIIISVTKCKQKKFDWLTLWAPTPQKGQTHWNYSLAVADELFKCVIRPICEGGTYRVKKLFIFLISLIAAAHIWKISWEYFPKRRKQQNNIYKSLD